MRLARATLSTPVGPMLALASEQFLCALEFDSGPRLSRLGDRLRRFFPGVTIEDGSTDPIVRARVWLDAYFAGQPASLEDLPLDGRGTSFEQRVWAALRRIPPGATASYGQIAAQVATAAASRAVGLANAANPLAIVVPCHRVIGASGALTGYGGGLDRKRWLLDHEERHWPTATSLSRAMRHPLPGRDGQPSFAF